MHSTFQVHLLHRNDGVAMALRGSPTILNSGPITLTLADKLSVASQLAFKHRGTCVATHTQPAFGKYGKVGAVGVADWGEKVIQHCLQQSYTRPTISYKQQSVMATSISPGWRILRLLKHSCRQLWPLMCSSRPARHSTRSSRTRHLVFDPARCKPVKAQRTESSRFTL